MHLLSTGVRQPILQIWKYFQNPPYLSLLVSVYIVPDLHHYMYMTVIVIQTSCDRLKSLIEEKVGYSSRQLQYHAQKLFLLQFA